MRKKIAVIDDKEEFLHLFKKILTSRIGNIDVSTYRKAKDALDDLLTQEFDLIITDLMMPEMDGLEFLRKAREIKPNATIIVLTGYPSIETSVTAMKEGAYDYVEKPINNDALVIKVNKALERAQLLRERENLSQIVQGRRFEIIGTSRAIQGVKQLVEKLAPQPVSVLIEGESGTGKELVARRIHLLSPRRSSSFVALNCAAIPEGLFESELFGHTRGSFTGAVSERKGLFEEADSGTLFLDEVDSVPKESQGKLLRAIEMGEIRAIGSDKPRFVDTRIITATKMNLFSLVQSGQFREDLYYRLNVVRIKIPPLRERREDIPQLAYYFLKIYSQKLGKNVTKISDSFMKSLIGRRWEGNVRELENLIAREVALSDSDILGESYSETSLPEETEGSGNITYKQAREEFDRNYIRSVLARTGWNISKAAKLAGMKRQSLQYIMKKYRIHRDENI